MRFAFPLKSALVALVLATPFTAMAAGKCDRLVATGASDNPPFLWRDPQNPKRLVGANADLLAQIADSLDLKLDLLYTGDRTKAFEEVRSGRVDVLADATLTVQRLEELDFVHPAILQLQTVAWVRNEPGFFYSSREDLRGHRGMVVSASRFGSEFDAFAKADLQLQQAAGLAQGLQKLVAGGGDYLLSERYRTVAEVDALGLLDKVQRLDPPVVARDMHLAISHDSACNDPWLRGQLARKMTELRAAGVPEQLVAHNLTVWKNQQAERANAPKK
ncbi:substrate-binding periplasmic protein [Stutzerimonas stutzeri]|uniref:Amino acid ABC transporter substrate-binding protein n=1 Tax=Stutzerimonas stutzeri TaxID=316 RepID=A0A2N8RJN1_STUST|nr:ABC transporter substrate-binding protein [Stutzerimonas stutzeri]MCQ4252440.1 ABC transporter substrate-binding protein [Stutzerimonas stutzeri]PNF61314.1 amino acid ABC transporter substrate-binding protein [Stutzerimonas stutzeri]